VLILCSKEEYIVAQDLINSRSKPSQIRTAYLPAYGYPSRVIVVPPARPMDHDPFGTFGGGMFMA
jgi:hypothetical protein